MVIDRETGAVPPSAAERMKIWDARFASQTPQQTEKRDTAPQTGAPAGTQQTQPPTENPWEIQRSDDFMQQRPAKVPMASKASPKTANMRKEIGYGPIIAIYAAAIGLLILFLGWGALPVAFALVIYSLMQQWPQKIQGFLQKLADQQGQSGTDRSARP